MAQAPDYLLCNNGPAMIVRYVHLLKVSHFVIHQATLNTRDVER